MDDLPTGATLRCRKCGDTADVTFHASRIVAPADCVPGLWRCAKCNFELIQRNLNADTGTVTARDQAGDRCPNCDAPLWRVTWQQHAEALAKTAEDMLERATAAERQVSEFAKSYRPSPIMVVRPQGDYAREADIEAAAKALADCMDYPWEHMPAQGRAEMLKNAQRIINAALGDGKDGEKA